jgi:hypothetical protein
MPTPANTEFDPNKPDGTTGTGTTYSSTDLDNLRAVRDMLVTGRVKGFVQTRTTGTGPDASHPQFVTWLNGTLGFRLKLTWAGTGNHQISTFIWQWSNDTGGTWTDMGGAGTDQVNTYDANDNITGTTNSGGFFTLILEIWTKTLRAVAGLATHIAATGTAVHGLGSMATQAASAVAITGGTANGMKFGDTTPADADTTRVRETFHDYGTIAAAGTVTLELDKYGHFAFTPNATTSNTITVAVSGAPASGKTQSWFIELVNGQRSADGKITWPANAKWVGGASARPIDTSLELAGRNLFAITTRDGGTRLEIQHIGKGG